MQPIKSVLGSAALGILSLAVLYAWQGYTGVWVPVSRLSLSVAGLLGVPGVTMMLLLQMLS